MTTMRRMWRWVIASGLVGALVAMPAAASTGLVDGFEVTDTAGTEGMTGLWAETLGGGAVTGDVALCTQSASCVVHHDLNGGALTSKHALKIDLASGESGYYAPGSTVTLNASQVVTHAAFYLPAAPPSAIIIHEHRESSDRGCYAELNTNLTITVKDGDGLTYGTTAKELEDSYCSGGSCTTDQDCLDASLGDICVSSVCQNIRTPCDEEADCPAAQDCGTCTTSTGAGCYWGTQELISTITGTTRLCELAWDGVVVVTGSPQTTSSANVTSFRLGVTSGLSGGGTTLYVDDVLAASSEDRTGMNYVARTCPNDDGTPLEWTRDTCGGAGPHEQCIDDYCTGSFVLGSGFVRASKVKTESFDGTESLTFNDAVSIRAVETQLIGSQSGTNTYTFDHRLLLCDDTDCTEVAPTITASGTGSTTNRVLARRAYDTTGIAGQQNWSAGVLAQLGSRWLNNAGNAATNRMHATIANVAVRRADAPSPITLCQNDGDTSDMEDHNAGADDGRCVIAAIGDSTAYGTLAVQCQNSTSQEFCNQRDFCSWDTVDRDKPAGGCNADDAACQTCADRQEDFNGGAGFGCGPNNDNVSCDQCGSSTDDAITGGCCSGGVCDGAEGIPCDIDADCVLGDCSTCTDGDCTAQTPTDTCELSCPGSGTACTTDANCSDGETCDEEHLVCSGTCPTGRASWPAYLPGTVAADLILQCGQGAETLASMVQTRFTDILTTGQTDNAVFGSGPCIAVQGTGVCGCDSNDDCGTGGTCTSGQCTAGDTTRTDCTQASDCDTAENFTCEFDPPDYVIVHEGYNDFYHPQGASASCIGIASLNQMTTGFRCDNCPTLTCTADSGCASRSADSECAGHVLGFGASGPDYPCSVNRIANFTVPSQCLLQSNACRADDDCALSGQTCEGYTGGDTADGWCDCGADDENPATNCPSGFSCLNGRCRKACTTDANCGTGGTCSTAGAIDVCFGMCTCPSNSSDMPSYPNAAACTSDEDCPGFGSCSGGECLCGGSPICIAAGDPCQQNALRYWNSIEALFSDASAPTGMSHFPYWVRRMFALEAELNDPDDRPVIIMSSLLPYADEDFPDRPSAPCYEGLSYRPPWAIHALRQQLASFLEFPHYVDPFLDWQNAADPDLHVDAVHPGPEGAALLGRTAIGGFLNSLNVCAQHAGTERALAQSYCRTTAGAWQSTTCDTLADCTAGQVCERRPCAAAGDCPNGTDDCNLQGGIP